ncbi:MAG: hypothetical protein C4541_05975 [Candidatus Auribacter fodinae]|jgi:hypothetical protein|uniref:Uncharacterized protein n=1 Tax=Candidatus Auribacter fodinae TaxID=2093366 RepID=A0A3A4RD41_9BACT|nr:MAG: hypothetical protein C4541_05975 [Candidatus Auribacter fodinae]
MKKLFSLLILVSLFGCFSLFSGCAADKSQIDPSWEKEVIIEFRRDIPSNLINYFLDSEYLQFMQQIDYNVVKARINTGESVADFKDRLSTHPDILNIYTEQEYNSLQP